MNFHDVYRAVTMVLLSTSPAFADECDPKNFVFSDVEKVDFSEALSLAVIDTVDSDRQENRDRNFSAAAIVKGVPIQLNGSEMKKVSQYIKATSDLNFSKQQQFSYFQTNPSLLGGAMYRDCLTARTKDFVINIPSAAYNEDEFLVTIQWTPQYSLDGRKPEANAQLTLATNATVEPTEQIVAHEKLVTFKVSRKQRSQSIQFVPNVDGRGDLTNSIVVIPPIVPRRHELKKREWKSTEEAILPVCTGDAGSSCGTQAKSFKRCISSNGGLLLAATAQFEEDGSSMAKPLLEASDTDVCYTFGTVVVGAQGHSALNRFAFSVFEVVPENSTAN